ncbi:hypothetical protein BKA56DRAFT_665741 [Ilyonectria sp. MPI-CAGE-AT-0026]|nr:hypothetical protein BKA56DRAFT_665741 [Ilyonectria sp. MPI-CAGE-AT-0026]
MVEFGVGLALRFLDWQEGFPYVRNEWLCKATYTPMGYTLSLLLRGQKIAQETGSRLMVSWSKEGEVMYFMGTPIHMDGLRAMVAAMTRRPMRRTRCGTRWHIQYAIIALRISGVFITITTFVNVQAGRRCPVRHPAGQHRRPNPGPILYPQQRPDEKEAELLEDSIAGPQKQDF